MLRTLLSNAVEAWWDHDAYERATEQEQVDRLRLTQVVRELGGER